MAANNNIPDISMKSVIRLWSHSECIFCGVFDSLRNLNVYDCNRTLHIRSHISNFYLLLFRLLLATTLLQTTHASMLPSAISTLSIYALNANGLVQPVKQSDINSIIKA